MSESSSSSDKRVIVICPNLSCRNLIHAPASARGKIVRCAACNTAFRVPANTPPPTKPVAGNAKPS